MHYHDSFRMAENSDRQGYFAREIPKEYGGYGGSIDILKNKIINSEFAKAGVPLHPGSRTDYLVPTLLEMGTEDKNKSTLANMHFEMIWCPKGFSEPNSGSDLASSDKGL
ncbi:MAG: hypothetical protein Ct9H300mP4_16890 [Gammaproteobacteria bacterium]|nr:MAG: hypothetical protein Ct9H300mP4_16890 [Gammaproteobacteria bacterium]